MSEHERQEWSGLWEAVFGEPPPIAADAALTARIIKVVNSPLLRTNKEITDLQMAVGRLGINYTCNLATGLAMEQMFQATSDVVDATSRTSCAGTLPARSTTPRGRVTGVRNGNLRP